MSAASPAGAGDRGERSGPLLDHRLFVELMQRLATAWTTGDAATAADCFTVDAVYVEPPDRQRYAGRAELYELAGGDEPSPMSMTWHHLAFDADRQVGFGEYTFRGRRQFHGITVVRLRDGRIHRWREYQYHDERDWAAFAGDSAF
jgi:ketosteroid isomerase-like protein